MHRTSTACLILSALPLLAEETAIDPYEDLPDYFPQHYRSLADVPEQYHDGEKLTGCFIHDSVRASWIHTTATSGPDDPDDDIECHNPFYWDEHGRIKNDEYAGDPSAEPPSGLPLGSEPRESQPTPCEGCLSEEQVLDIFRVYHRELGIEPLGYRVKIIRGFPWNGIGHPDFCDKYDPNYHDSLHPDPRDPHPNERVNMRRVYRPMMGWNELADICKDPQNRDLTWVVAFQIGWDEPENRILNEHNQHMRDWPRTPCTATHVIHAQTGKIRGGKYYRLLGQNPGEYCRGATVDNLENLVGSGYQAWKAWYDAYQRVFLYLPNSPVRSQGNSYLDLNSMQPIIESWKREAKEREARKKRESEERERDMHGDHHHLPPIDLRGVNSPDVLLDSTRDNGAQHIIVYWGESPTIDVENIDDCKEPDPDNPKKKRHVTKCKARVPKIKQCDGNNIPYSEPPATGTTTHDCILWTRLKGREECHYRNEKGRRERGWCARESQDGTRYRGKGFTSRAIHKHIAAVESLTAHQVGMRYNDGDFEDQKDRLKKLFPKTTFSDNDAFAEINLFDHNKWSEQQSGNGFYLHRYGDSEHDDPPTDSRKNDQYRRINAPFDWYTRDAWCVDEDDNCDEDRIRYRYVLVHESVHDVTSDHLLDTFSWPNRPVVSHAFFQTKGVLEGHALFIEEFAGRKREYYRLDDPHPSGSGNYELLTKLVDNRKKTPLANEENYVATAQALLVAFRGVEDALAKAARKNLVPFSRRAAHYETRKLFNNSLHSYTPLHELFGRPNMHVDFCEVRNEVQRRVWLLRKAVNDLTPFSVPLPNITSAFEDMHIETCMRPWDASSTKECAEGTGASPTCRKVSCEFNPGDYVPVMFPPSVVSSDVEIEECKIQVGDFEIVERNGAYEICVSVTWVINGGRGVENGIEVTVTICYSIAL